MPDWTTLQEAWGGGSGGFCLTLKGRPFILEIGVFAGCCTNSVHFHPAFYIF